MLIDRDNLSSHRFWIVFSGIIFLAASVWYFAASAAAGVLLGGSSLPGLALGVLAALIMIFEMLLWLRKKKRTWRIGRAQAWMRAHIWLGLLSGPLVLYHSGFRMGGLLTTCLAVLVILVIASGIWGLLMQQWLPRRMLEEIPGETIYSQIDHVAGLMERDAEALVAATCGVPEESPAAAWPSNEEGRALQRAVGAVRAAGRWLGRIPEGGVPAAPVPGAEPLQAFFRTALAPYLLQGQRAGPLLAEPRQAEDLFQDLRTKIPPAAHEVIDTLERMAGERRQMDRQARLYLWLHNWLLIHVPLSAALLVLMLAHIFLAIKYW